MNGAASSDSAAIPLRGEPKPPFCWVANEILDVFLPLMGADCFTLYATFARRVFSNPKLTHTVRDLADATGLAPGTVSRSLEILECLQLVKLTRFGGSKESECELKDSRVVAIQLRANYNPATLSYSLPPEVASRLKNKVKAIRERQQGKSLPVAHDGTSSACGNRPFRVSQRNASVSLATRQRSTRETQMGSHLIREERRSEEGPSPTPSHDCGAQNPKSSPDDEPDLLLWAQIKFTGVVNDMRDHLLDTSKPLVPHLANGGADWEEFRFNRLAVESAARRGEGLELVFAASDPAAAQRGLSKYRKTWEASLRKWFNCEVHVELRAAQESRSKQSGSARIGEWGEGGSKSLAHSQT